MRETAQVETAETEVILRELSRVLGRGVSGDAVELGCYTGDTSLLLAGRLAGTGKKLYLYDSFAGLPEKTREDLSSAGEDFKAGELFASKSALMQRLARAGLRGASAPVVKKAWFSDLRAEDLPEEIAFAFLDGDYYGSIRDSLRLIQGKLTDGAVIVVDDYQNEALPGVARAVDEWMLAMDSTMHSKVLRLRVEKSLAIIY